MSAATPTRWTPPPLEVPAVPLVTVEEVEPEAVVPPSLEEIQAIREQAYQAAYEEGIISGQAQGFAQGHSEVRRLIAQIEGILDNFTRPLARLESEVTAALGELAVRIAGHLVGRAYANEPDVLTALLAQALDAVGSTTREVEVHLHPDDLATLNAPACEFSPTKDVRLVPAPNLSRGDLRVHTEHMRIDGSLQARLQQALEQVMQQTERTA